MACTEFTSLATKLRSFKSTHLGLRTIRAALKTIVIFNKKTFTYRHFIYAKSPLLCEFSEHSNFSLLMCRVKIKFVPIVYLNLVKFIIIGVVAIV